MTKASDHRFLIVPELKQGERWKYAGIVDHPVFKQGPFLRWENQATQKVCMINRQLFYMMMRGRMT